MARRERKKSPAQLDHEIASALVGRRGRGTTRHHATRVGGPHPSDPAWDVAMDAILEGNPKKAAEIYQQIREEHGRVSAPASFTKAMRQVPANVRQQFKELKSPGPKRDRGPKTPTGKAVDFFRKRAGYGRDPSESKAKARTRNAQALARAEAEAEARGWTVEWQHDQDEWQGCDARPDEVLVAVLRDAEGNVLGSLGGIGMSGNLKTDQDYARVIEAELAAEVL